jgi:geranylgeranyl pyrophosphate synthase
VPRPAGSAADASGTLNPDEWDGITEDADCAYASEPSGPRARPDQIEWGQVDRKQLLKRVRGKLQDWPSTGMPEVDRLLSGALSQGKMLRPELALLAGQLAHGESGMQAREQDRLVDAAASVEFLHVASLVHDDVVDEAATRRGEPSVYAQAGGATAILLGDLVLARGAACAAVLDLRGSAAWAEALEALTRGQLMESFPAADRSLAHHVEYIGLKTAALMKASCVVGAVAVDADQQTLEALARFGHHYGVAFQHADDLLDVLGDPAALGKPVHSDLGNGVWSATALFARDRAGASSWGSDVPAAYREMGSPRAVDFAASLLLESVALAGDALVGLDAGNTEALTDWARGSLASMLHRGVTPEGRSRLEATLLALRE